MITNGEKELYDALYIKTEAHICPVCKETLFPCEGSNLICKVCGWEDDWQQLEKPDMVGGANRLSCNQYKQWWAEEQKKGKQQ